MIRSFGHKGFKNFFEQGDKSGINAQFAKLCLQSLLDAAVRPEQMSVPGYNLHELRGELAGHWAIKVSGNWRLTFRFAGEDADIVDLQDYH